LSFFICHRWWHGFLLFSLSFLRPEGKCDCQVFYFYGHFPSKNSKNSPKTSLFLPVLVLVINRKEKNYMLMFVALKHPLLYKKVSFCVFLVLFQLCTLYCIQKINIFFLFGRPTCLHVIKWLHKKGEVGHLFSRRTMACLVIGHHGGFSRLIDCCLDAFPHTSRLLVTYFSSIWEKQAKWVLVNNYKKECYHKYKHQFLAFFSFL